MPSRTRTRPSAESSSAACQDYALPWETDSSDQQKRRRLDYWQFLALHNFYHMTLAITVPLLVALKGGGPSRSDCARLLLAPRGMTALEHPSLNTTNPRQLLEAMPPTHPRQLLEAQLAYFSLNVSLVLVDATTFSTSTRDVLLLRRLDTAAWDRCNQRKTSSCSISRYVSLESEIAPCARGCLQDRQRRVLAVSRRLLSPPPPAPIAPNELLKILVINRSCKTALGSPDEHPHHLMCSDGLTPVSVRGGGRAPRHSLHTTYGRIVDSLARSGRFDIVWTDFSDVPFAEQADLVRDVHVILSVHGAGLTHLLWAQPGTAVVELTPYEGARSARDLGRRLPRGMMYESLAADLTALGWPIMHFYYFKKHWIGKEATCPREEAAIAAKDRASAVRERWACFDGDALTRLLLRAVVPAVLHSSWGWHRNRNNNTA